MRLIFHFIQVAKATATLRLTLYTDFFFDNTFFAHTGGLSLYLNFDFLIKILFTTILLKVLEERA
jgi:hypothetical protein